TAAARAGPSSPACPLRCRRSCSRSPTRSRSPRSARRAPRAGAGRRPSAACASAAGAAAALLPAGARPLEIAGQQVCRGPRIVRSRTVCLREPGREALVEALDRDVDRRAQGLDEGLCLLRLRTALAAKRQRQADDDALRLLGAD